MKYKKILCPVCESSDCVKLLNAFNAHGSQIYNTTKQFVYYECKFCNAVFLVKVIPDKNYFKTYYSSDYREENVSSGVSAYIIQYSNKVKESLIEKFVQKKSNTKIKILDIGSGNGAFLKGLDAKKYDRYGFEIDKKLTTSYAKYKITAVTGGSLPKKIGSLKFDCITMWHVIEHLSDPNAEMKKIINLIKPNGVLLISTPNTESIGFQKGKENWFHLDAPRHFILYSKETLKKLAKSHGFEVLHTRNNWHDFPLDLFSSLKNNKNKIGYYALYPFVKFMDKETITQVWRKE